MAELRSMVKRVIGKPRVVGKAQGEAAQDYLRSHSGIEDFDAFLRDVEREDLLSEPLGPTKDCLSADELAAYCEGPATEISADRLKRIREHLLTCDDCPKSVELYRKLTNRRSASDLKVQIVEPELVVVEPGALAAFNLTLVANRDLAAGVTVQCSAMDVHVHQMKREFQLFGTRYSLICKIDKARFLELGGSEVCDKITVKGKTKTGEEFAAFSQLCLKKA